MSMKDLNTKLIDAAHIGDLEVVRLLEEHILQEARKKKIRILQ